MKKKMISFKVVLAVVLLLLVAPFVVYAEKVFNSQGDFEVTIYEQNKAVFNDEIKASFDFSIKNSGYSPSQKIFIEIDESAVSGFDVEVEGGDTFVLGAYEVRDLKIIFSANSEFDYSTQASAPDLVLISQKEDYLGSFEFPIEIRGTEESVSVNFNLAINRKGETPINFVPRISSNELSPILQLKFSVYADNIDEGESVSIKAFLDDEVIVNIEETFDTNSYYKIFSVAIPGTISPKISDARVVVRLLQDDGKSAKEWFDTREVLIQPYENLEVGLLADESFFKDNYVVRVANKGNVDSVHLETIPVSWFRHLFFSSDTEYEKVKGGVKYEVTVERGSEVRIEYWFNYISLYLTLLFLTILCAYFFARTFTPLSVETRIYEVKKVKYEGVKSLKVRIGFENIREYEIESLKVIFRMPSYLRVDNDSFLLSPPKNALKGRNQFKLIWEFKKFAANDARVLGFMLVNSRGVLGDIRIPPLELEVKSRGRIKKYYKSFPIVKG